MITQTFENANRTKIFEFQNFTRLLRMQAIIFETFIFLNSSKLRKRRCDDFFQESLVLPFKVNFLKIRKFSIFLSSSQGNHSTHSWKWLSLSLARTWGSLIDQKLGKTYCVNFLSVSQEKGKREKNEIFEEKRYFQ